MIDSFGMKVGARLTPGNHPENQPQTKLATPPGPENLEVYLSRLIRLPVRICSMSPLSKSGSISRPGRGVPLRIDYDAGDERRSAVLETLIDDPAGEGVASPVSTACRGDSEEAPPPPHHVRELGTGRLITGAGLVSECPTEQKIRFRITEYVDGRAYGEDLVRLKLGGLPKNQDPERAEALAAHLAEIHQERGSDPKLYVHCARELLGGADGILGILDGFPPQDGLLIPELLEHLEHRCLKWTWRLKGKTHRLRRIHGRYHPWNLLFRDGTDFTVVDASPGRWGEPAEDVACLTVNYLSFALQSQGESRRMLFELFGRFWSKYIEKSGDSEILDVAAPFVVRHVLALTSPTWAPEMKSKVRRSLFSFMFRVLEASRFDPYRVEKILCED